MSRPNETMLDKGIHVQQIHEQITKLYANDKLDPLERYARVQQKYRQIEKLNSEIKELKS